jgi:hypothetical protein
VVDVFVVQAEMVSKCKRKVTFKQWALMFTSRGELLTATMAEVLNKRAESSKTRSNASV